MSNQNKIQEFLDDTVHYTSLKFTSILEYYKLRKQALSKICGFDAGENYNPELYDNTLREMIKKIGI